MISNPIGN